MKSEPRKELAAALEAAMKAALADPSTFAIGDGFSPNGCIVTPEDVDIDDDAGLDGMLEEVSAQKWVVTTDSICDGVVADKDENGCVILYNSEDEAAREALEWAWDWQSDMQSHHENGQEPEEDFYHMEPEALEEMRKLSCEGTAEQISAFCDKHPDMDMRDMGWEPAEGFIDERKAIWTGNGGHVEGTPLERNTQGYGGSTRGPTRTDNDLRHKSF